MKVVRRRKMRIGFIGRGLVAVSGCWCLGLVSRCQTLVLLCQVIQKRRSIAGCIVIKNGSHFEIVPFFCLPKRKEPKKKAPRTLRSDVKPCVFSEHLPHRFTPLRSWTSTRRLNLVTNRCKPQHDKVGLVGTQIKKNAQSVLACHNNIFPSRFA